MVWPGYSENFRALVWLLAYRGGEATGMVTPVGVVLSPDELNLDGLDISDADLRQLLNIDDQRWEEEMQQRDVHLNQFVLPNAITAVHARIKEAFTAGG